MKKQQPMRRGAGILLPVFSLPSPYGIGTFGKAAYEFVDFLRAAGQKYWQVLPLGPTGYGDSPYQSFSAFAGNPYFIDPGTLAQEGLLTGDEIAALDWGGDPQAVDYGLLYENRYPLLQAAFARAGAECSADYRDFCREHEDWLPGYCAFMAGKTAYPESFWGFCQFHFFRQWDKLKAYANGFGIEIIGDIPLYVAPDSADVTDNSEQFQLDGQGRPTHVAGVPPDGFSDQGQRWGNPLYNWERMARDGFAWWKRRMKQAARMYDLVRIDHFIGIAHYWSIPAACETAKDGKWIPGPGEALLEAIGTVMGEKRVIAEDLGEVTERVHRIRDLAGYPGMKPMIYAFGGDGYNPYLPCNFPKNLMTFGGCHDNEPLMGYFMNCPRPQQRFAREYLHVRRNADIAPALIRAGYESSADLAVFQLQDHLLLGNEARINYPGNQGGNNWRWRLRPEQDYRFLAEGLARMCVVYGR